MILIAIIFPGLSFILRGKLLSGIVAILLQVFAFLTSFLFGLGFIVWVILAAWAVVSYFQGKADRRNEALINAIKNKGNSDNGYPYRDRFDGDNSSSRFR